MSALEYEFKASSISECTDIQTLKYRLNKGNWAIGQCFVYRDLVFINQVNGGDEWYTLKFFGEELVGFESITFRPMIHDYKGEEFECYSGANREPKECCFESFIERLLKATKEQCLHCEY